MKIILSTDKKQLASGWDNVAFVKAKVTDADGVTVPRAKDLIRFSISGPGVRGSAPDRLRRQRGLVNDWAEGKAGSYIRDSLHPSQPAAQEILEFAE